MLTFVYDLRQNLVEVTTEYRADGKCRIDWDTMREAEDVAEEATALMGRLHVACDRGPYVSPRFDVIAMVQVGDEVSRRFNGDSYPAGKVVKISKSLRRVEAEDGTVFFRVGRSDSWRANGTWFMARGKHNERNPSF